MAEQKRDYYEVLGVDRGADEATIKKAYSMTSSAMPLLKAEQAARAEADSTSPVWIWVIFSEIYSETFSEAAPDVRHITDR